MTEGRVPAGPSDPKGTTMTGTRAHNRTGWLAVVVTLVLLAAPAVPAAAHHAPPAESHNPGGNGRVEGHELVEDQAGIPCFRVTRHLFGLRGTGTYEGRTAAGGPVVFRGAIGAGETLHANGPLQVQIENTEPYYHSPFGTHGTEASGGAGCSPSTTGNPVPAQFRVFAAEGTQDTDGDKDVDVLTGAAWVYRLDGMGAKVPCRARGSYARGTKDNPAFGDPTEVAEWTLEEDCVVVGNAAGTPGTGTAPRGTFHTFHGEHDPCFGDVMAGDCPDNIRHDYAQFLPKPGPFLSLSGPSSAAIGCDRPATLSARLTVDGVPQRDALVNFSVTGPAPAAPPAGAAPTDADGRAGFTCGAAQPGNYTVTASVTHAGQQRVATHTVRFDQLPPLSVSVGGTTRGQTEDPVTVIARVRDGCGLPLPGAAVNFTVGWPAQANPWTGGATPASGAAVTDHNGMASFGFTGDRAGDYAVTASVPHASAPAASATGTVRLDVKTMRRVGSLEVPSHLGAAVMDPGGRFAYFGPTGSTEINLNPPPPQMVKVDLATLAQVDAITLTPFEEGTMGSAVIDPAGDFAYFGASGSPGRVVKIDLDTFERVGALTLAEGEQYLDAAVIDPAGDFAYFGTGDFTTGKVVKIDLRTFQRVGALTLPEGERYLQSAVMDPGGTSAYFGTQTSPAQVIKIDLARFERAGAITLPVGESSFTAAVIDRAGDYAYFGVDSYPGKVVKVGLAPLRRVGAVAMPARVDKLGSAVIDLAGRFAYFGALVDAESIYYEGGPGVPRYDYLAYQTPRSDGIVKIDLESFDLAHILPLGSGEEEPFVAVIDPAGGHAYFGTRFTGSPFHPADNVPPRVVKVSLTRPASPALTAAADAYTTDYETPLTVPAPGVLAGDTDADGDPLVAGQASDPAGGNVTLNRNGSFTYTPDARFAGTDTFTYTASDGTGYSAPATVSIAVAPPAGPQANSFNYYTNVSLFGGPSTLRGHGQDAAAPATATSPSATCPAGGGPASVTDADGARAQYGPAVIFGGIWPVTSSQAPPSGPLTSSVDCPADGSYVTTSTAATLMPSGSAHPGGVGPGPFIADEVRSTCSARAGSHTVSTRIVNGILETKYDPNTQEAVTTEPIPTEPPANYTRTGTIDHVGDSYRIVFNEQIVHPDGSRTVNAAHMYLLGPTAVGDMVVGSSTCGPVATTSPRAALADFDGDGDTDRSVFRAGAWYAEGQPTAFFGVAGDLAVPGDYDGDGDLDRAVYRGGTWLTEGQPAVSLGTGDDVPVPGDYDGDGHTDRAVFRPSVGAWFIEGQATIYHGASGDVPVPGDYDGDGDADVAVWRPASGGWHVAGQATQWLGLQGDVPVPGDYDGDGTTDRAVWRPSSGGWHVDGQATQWLGLQGDVPVPGTYAAGATTKRAVWRPAVGGWYVDGQATAYLGTGGDQPLPVPVAVYRAVS